jgi:hypothetical protein
MAIVKFFSLVLNTTELCNLTQVGFNTIILHIKANIEKNWGSPFIVAFILLLVVVDSALFTGLFSLADTVAVYAYYALVAGVVLQLVCFLKYRRRSNDEVAL